MMPGATARFSRHFVRSRQHIGRNYHADFVWPISKYEARTLAVALQSLSSVAGSYLDPNCRFLHNGSIVEEIMATLNIKNLPDRLYRKIQARAHREHRSIAQEVIHILSEATEHSTPLSILELQGLGKDVWKKVDAGKHVNRERREWD